MKRLFFVFILLTFLLSSCEKTTETEITLETYMLSSSTFESFYAISKNVEEIEGTTLFTIELLPLETILVSDAEINIRVFFEFEFEETLLKGHFEAVIVLDGFNQTIHQSYLYGENYLILGYEIIEASGLVTSNQVITVESKSYLKPFLLEESSTDMLTLYIELLNGIDDYDYNLQNHVSKSLLHITYATLNQRPYINQTFTFSEKMIKEPFYYQTLFDD